MTKQTKPDLLDEQALGRIRLDIAETIPSSSPIGLFRQHCEDLLRENAALRKQLAQMRETLTSCDSVLSYVYHRERSRLLPETQQQLSDTMREVEKITRRKP